MNYLINVLKIIIENLPMRREEGVYRLNTQDRLDWLWSLFVPFQNIRLDFLDFVSAKRYDLTRTAQVIMLEDLLNNEFDNVNRQIYIGDANLLAYTFLYMYQENQPATAFFMDTEIPPNVPPSLYLNEEYDQGYDFIVFVPTGLLYDEEKLRALVNKYKLAGKRYIIQYF
jgi:hypothetical protein